MKTIKQFINDNILEKLILSKNSKSQINKITISTKKDLESLIRQRCNLLDSDKYLDLSDIKLDKSINDLSWLFKDKKIKKLNVSNWNVDNINNFTGVFCDCDELIEIVGLDDWDVKSGTNYYKMFYGCKSLTDIDGITQWNVKDSENFSYMFYGCEQLDILLDNWDIFRLPKSPTTYNMTKKSKVALA